MTLQEFKDNLTRFETQYLTDSNGFVVPRPEIDGLKGQVDRVSEFSTQDKSKIKRALDSIFSNSGNKRQIRLAYGRLNNAINAAGNRSVRGGGATGGGGGTGQSNQPDPPPNTPSIPSQLTTQEASNRLREMRKNLLRERLKGFEKSSKSVQRSAGSGAGESAVANPLFDRVNKIQQLETMLNDSNADLGEVARFLDLVEMENRKRSVTSLSGEFPGEEAEKYKEKIKEKSSGIIGESARALFETLAERMSFLSPEDFEQKTNEIIAKLPDFHSLFEQATLDMTDEEKSVFMEYLGSLDKSTGTMEEFNSAMVQVKENFSEVMDNFKEATSAMSVEEREIVKKRLTSYSPNKIGGQVDELERTEDLASTERNARDYIGNEEFGLEPKERSMFKREAESKIKSLLKGEMTIQKFEEVVDKIREKYTKNVFIAKKGEKFKDTLVGSAISDTKKQVDRERYSELKSFVETQTRDLFEGSTLQKTILLLFKGRLGMVLSGAVGVVRKLLGVFGSLAGALGSLVSSIVDFTKKIVSTTASIGWSLLKWIGILTILYKTGLLQKIGPFITDFLRGIAPFLLKVVQSVFSAMNEFLEWAIQSLASGVGGESWGKKLKDFFFGREGIFSTEVARKTGEELKRFFKNIRNILPILGGVIKDMITGIVTIMKDFVYPEILKPLLDSFFEWMEGDGLGKKFKEYVYDPVTSLAKGIWWLGEKVGWIIENPMKALGLYFLTKWTLNYLPLLIMQGMAPLINMMRASFANQMIPGFGAGGGVGAIAKNGLLLNTLAAGGGGYALKQMADRVTSSGDSQAKKFNSLRTFANKNPKGFRAALGAAKVGKVGSYLAYGETAITTGMDVYDELSEGDYGDAAGTAVAGGVKAGSIWAGGALGAKTGALIGALGGPIGAAIGAAVGGIGGMIAGSMLGDESYENMREWLNEDEDEELSEEQKELLDSIDTTLKDMNKRDRDARLKEIDEIQSRDKVFREILGIVNRPKTGPSSGLFASVFGLPGSGGISGGLDESQIEELTYLLSSGSGFSGPSKVIADYFMRILMDKLGSAGPNDNINLAAIIHEMGLGMISAGAMPEAERKQVMELLAQSLVVTAARSSGKQDLVGLAPLLEGSSISSAYESNMEKIDFLQFQIANLVSETGHITPEDREKYDKLVSEKEMFESVGAVMVLLDDGTVVSTSAGKLKKLPGIQKRLQSQSQPQLYDGGTILPKNSAVVIEDETAVNIRGQEAIVGDRDPKSPGMPNPELMVNSESGTTIIPLNDPRGRKILEEYRLSQRNRFADGGAVVDLSSTGADSGYAMHTPKSLEEYLRKLVSLSDLQLAQLGQTEETLQREIMRVSNELGKLDRNIYSVVSDRSDGTGTVDIGRYVREGEVAEGALPSTPTPPKASPKPKPPQTSGPLPSPAPPMSLPPKSQEDEPVPAQWADGQEDLTEALEENVEAVEDNTNTLESRPPSKAPNSGKMDFRGSGEFDYYAAESRSDVASKTTSTPSSPEAGGSVGVDRRTIGSSFDAKSIKAFGLEFYKGAGGAGGEATANDVPSVPKNQNADKLWEAWKNLQTAIEVSILSGDDPNDSKVRKIRNSIHDRKDKIVEQIKGIYGKADPASIKKKMKELIKEARNEAREVVEKAGTRGGANKFSLKDPVAEMEQLQKQRQEQESKLELLDSLDAAEGRVTQLEERNVEIAGTIDKENLETFFKSKDNTQKNLDKLNKVSSKAQDEKSQEDIENLQKSEEYVTLLKSKIAGKLGEDGQKKLEKLAKELNLPAMEDDKALSTMEERTEGLKKSLGDLANPNSDASKKLKERMDDRELYEGSLEKAAKYESLMGEMRSNTQRITSDKTFLAQNAEMVSRKDHERNMTNMELGRIQGEESFYGGSPGKERGVDLGRVASMAEEAKKSDARAVEMKTVSERKRKLEGQLGRIDREDTEMTELEDSSEEDTNRLNALLTEYGTGIEEYQEYLGLKNTEQKDEKDLQEIATYLKTTPEVLNDDKAKKSIEELTKSYEDRNKRRKELYAKFEGEQNKGTVEELENAINEIAGLEGKAARLDSLKRTSEDRKTSSGILKGELTTTTARFDELIGEDMQFAADTASGNQYFDWGGGDNTHRFGEIAVGQEGLSLEQRGDVVSSGQAMINATADQMQGMLAAGTVMDKEEVDYSAKPYESSDERVSAAMKSMTPEDKKRFETLMAATRGTTKSRRSFETKSRDYKKLSGGKDERMKTLERLETKIKAGENLTEEEKGMYESLTKEEEKYKSLSSWRNSESFGKEQGDYNMGSDRQMQLSSIAQKYGIDSGSLIGELGAETTSALNPLDEKLSSSVNPNPKEIAQQEDPRGGFFGGSKLEVFEDPKSALEFGQMSQQTPPITINNFNNTSVNGGMQQAPPNIVIAPPNRRTNVPGMDDALVW